MRQFPYLGLSIPHWLMNGTDAQAVRPYKPDNQFVILLGLPTTYEPKIWKADFMLASNAHRYSTALQWVENPEIRRRICCQPSLTSAWVSLLCQTQARPSPEGANLLNPWRAQLAWGIASFL